MIQFQFNDGGREAAGFKGKAGDCVARAIAIATETPYREVYDSLNDTAKSNRPATRSGRKSNARTGVFKRDSRAMLASMGWTWVPLMKIGQGCKHHLRADELPAGRIIVKLSRHLAAVVDGVLNDTFDCSRGGTRAVYGYWHKA